MMPGAGDSTLRVCVAWIVAESVDRTAERIDDAADQLGTDRHFEHAAGAADFVAFLELQVVAEDDGADVVFFEVEREAGDDVLGLGGGELEHLAGHGLAEAVDAGDTVLHFQDRTDFLDVEVGEIGSVDLAEENVLDFAGAKGGLGGHDARAMKAERTACRRSRARFGTSL